MQKIAFLVLMFILTAGSAFAAFVGPGVTGASSVSEARKAADNTPCTLDGRIVREIRPEHYIFRDDSGDIEVEIDNEVFMGRDINPTTRIRIYGEVDQEVFESPKVDVKRLDIKY